MTTKTLINYHELLDEAKNGTISPEQIEFVAQQLIKDKDKNKNNLYTIIHILGRAKAVRYKILIEPFLYYRHDPLIAKITLQTLCTYWDLTKDYLDQLKIFIKGIAWDDMDDVRLVAISIAGEYLRSTANTELLQSLLDVFDNEDCSLIKSCGYHAMARAMGKEYIQIQENTLDPLLIEQVRTMCASQFN